MGSRSFFALFVISGVLATVSCAITENKPRDIDGLMFEFLMTRLEEMESRMLSYFDERINLLENNNAIKMKDMTERINLLEQNNTLKIREITDLLNQNNAVKMKDITEKINLCEQNIATLINDIAKQMGTIKTNTEDIQSELSDVSEVQSDLSNTIKNSLRSFQMKNQQQTEAAPHMKEFLLSCEALASSIPRGIDQTTGSGVFAVKTGPDRFAWVYRNTSNSHEYGNGWIVVQNRFEGKVGFNRSWQEYRSEFGNKKGEQWLGLVSLYNILQTGRHELLIMYETFDGYLVYAHYDNFIIGHESEQFAVKSLGKYTGSTIDAYMKLEVGLKFPTDDKVNLASCPEAEFMGWWMKSCNQHHINDHYFEGKGIPYRWKDDLYCWKSTKMMIRLHAENK